jgi:hypothetical protein
VYRPPNSDCSFWTKLSWSIDKVGEISDKIILDDSNETLPTMYSLCSNFLCNITINEQEIIDIISILRVNKAVGPDFISHKMLKAMLLIVAKPLTMFFNRSLSEKKNHFRHFGN